MCCLTSLLHAVAVFACWVQLPLFVGKAKGLLNKQLVGGQTPASAPVMCGTPRYLQLR